jgi:hypothetical protein
MPFGFRSDADAVKDVPPTRAIMPFIMRGRNESAVYFEVFVDATPLRAFIESERARTGQKVTVLHLVIAAATRALHERPRLNRFVQGSRLWQRRGIWMSFSGKRQKNDEGHLVAMKRRIDPAWPLARVVEEIDGSVGAARSGKDSATDKELKTILALPRFLVGLVTALGRFADRHGVLPPSMIASDPLFATMFVANLGSIGMDAPFHHLYEWGNIGLFCAIGQERDGKLPLRFTFDERIEDGLYCLKSIERLKAILEDPAATFRV